MTIQKFLEKIANILDEIRVDYVVSGGVAVSIWGKPRYTADVDIVVELKSLDSVEKMILLLQKEIKKSYLDKDRAIDAFKQKSEFNLIEPEYGLKADFFVAKADEYGQLAIKRGETKKIGNKSIKFISPEDLIISKLIWFKESGSTRQLEDISSVMDIQRKLDKRYLNSWIKKLDLEKEWSKVKK